jgi:hypothetical protein
MQRSAIGGEEAGERALALAERLARRATPLAWQRHSWPQGQCYRSCLKAPALLGVDHLHVCSARGGPHLL